jgi:ribose transport system permease protein
MSNFAEVLKKRKIDLSRFGIFFALLFIVIIFTISSRYFLTVDNIFSVLQQSSLNLIIALGMTFVIALGGIDLSVGSVVAFSSVVMADWIANAGVPLIIAVVGAIVIGIAAGFINGILIDKLKLQAFIVTLATMTFFRGAALVYTNGRAIYGFPQVFRDIFAGNICIVPTPVLWALLIFLVCWFLMKNTKVGEYILAIGGNEEAAKYSGINISRYRIMIYSLIGGLTAFSSIILTARLDAAEPIAGYFFELDAIAATVMGGTPLSGGRVNLLGTVVGALILGVLRNGLTLLNFQSYFQQMVMGVVIIIAVAADRIRVE